MDISNGHPLIVIAAPPPEEADGMPASIPTLITGIGTLNAAIALTKALADAHSRGHRPHHIDLPTVTSLPTAGLATGDTFTSDTATRDRLAQQAQLCDIEGYAVVKVAREFGIPVTLNLTFTIWFSPRVSA
ncbi:hypothetical protein NY054_04930 [Corynebacterium diphtheriae bv. mitis]|nr:hypothetical protein NY054_04930 [Corynebacterium diphtheriae bv. mitis]